VPRVGTNNRSCLEQGHGWLDVKCYNLKNIAIFHSKFHSIGFGQILNFRKRISFHSNEKFSDLDEE